jgi:hypothetical protein
LRAVQRYGEKSQNRDVLAKGDEPVNDSKVFIALLLSFMVFASVVTAEEKAAAVEGKNATVEAAETEEPLSYGASVQFLSKYVSRGAVVSGDPVLQPEVWLSYKGFTFDIWNNVDLTDYEIAPWRLTESDFTVEYAFSLSKATIGLGYSYYTYPNLHYDDTQEFYASACLDVFLSPELTVYYDIDEICGVYANGLVRYAVPLGLECKGEKVNAELSAAVGWGDSNYIGGCFDDTGESLVDLLLSCAVPVKLSDNVSLTPSISYMTVLDSHLRQCTGKSDALYGGIAVTVEF